MNLSFNEYLNPSEILNYKFSEILKEIKKEKPEMKKVKCLLKLNEKHLT